MRLILTNRYIYFSATTCNGNNNNPGIFVLQITNPDPFNRLFTFKGELHDVANERTIDDTVFEYLSSQGIPFGPAEKEMFLHRSYYTLLNCLIHGQIVVNEFQYQDPGKTWLSRNQ